MSMVQAFSYNFSTVENPLSDSGNFVTMNNGVFTGGTLQTVSGNLCEAAASGTWGVSLYDGTVVAPGGVLPNDQYAEITLATWTQSPTVSQFYLFVRSSATIGNFAGWHIVNGASNSELFIVTGGTTKNSLSNTCSPAQGDVWRLSVTGNVYTLTQNGSVISTFTDSGNYLTSGYVGLGINGTGITTTQVNLFAAGANQCATPTFSPVAGSYTGTQTVTVTSTTSGCTIYYTTNGTTPTESSSSIANGGTVSVASSLTLKAIASLADNLDSAVGSATYTINGALTTPSSSFGFGFKLGF